MVEATDLVLTNPDELSVMTYAGYFRAWAEDGMNTEVKRNVALTLYSLNFQTLIGVWLWVAV